VRIKKVQLINFKRFDDLTIDLSDSPKKVIALVGPNGSGKSSVFDAFEEEMKNHRTYHRASEEPSFFSKLFFSRDPKKKTEEYNKYDSVKIQPANTEDSIGRKSFHIRNSYRFTPKLKAKSLQSHKDIIENTNGPTSSIDLDKRLEENYERLWGDALTAFTDDKSGETGKEVRERIIGEINSVLSKVLDVKISSLGNIVDDRGQLYFEKDSSIDFPYDNLSSGEKEVVDIIIDLIIRIKHFDDTVYCIDEPELHLNTAVQRRLLLEIERLIPENCQLWVATHSIGFLRALQSELKDKVQVIDFSQQDYFNGTKTAVPIELSRRNWVRIFETALEDITGLMAPEKIFYCEGRPDPSANGEEQGIDAQVYNQIFEIEHSDSLFISAGGADMVANSSLALSILSKAFVGVEVFRLKDRDGLTQEERKAFIGKNGSNRMLYRREIENYLFDKEILKLYCQSVGVAFDENRFDEIVIDIKKEDLKGEKSNQLTQMCDFRGSPDSFMIELAKHVRSETAVYSFLEADIFQS